MRRVVQRSRRVCHVDDLLHERQCGLYGLHPCLRAAVQGIHLSDHPLAIGIVHLRELRGEHRIHLILLVLMGNLHIGERQETGREILRRGECALSRVGIEQHLVALGPIVVGQQPLAHQPLAEELSHFCLQHASAQRQLTARRRPREPHVGCHPHVGSRTRHQRRADVMATHHHDFFQLILCPEVIRAFCLGLSP